MSKTQPARGMRDFLPADIRKREYVIGIIKEVYESYGFEPLETPAVENLETLTGKYGEEGNQLIFKILKRGEKLGESFSSEKDLADLALRYDLTVPLARVVAQHKNDLPKFFKRYQIQPVWRADRPARGRFREFYQCDVDAIGSSSIIVEAELCSAVCEILQRLGFDDFIINLNHRRVLVGMLNSADVPVEKHNIALVALDKLDKVGKEGVEKELIERGISSDAADQLVYVRLMDEAATELFESTPFQQWNEFTISYLMNSVKRQLKSGSEEEKDLHLGIKDLESILRLNSNIETKNKIRLNPHLARGLSYYTGAIFEINVPDLAGSLGGGGRYDGLIGMFGKEQIPACGFSLGLERILFVMEERGMFQKLIDEGKLKLDSADVLVTIWDEESIGESLSLANELRRQGLRVFVYPEADKLGKQFKYASQINVSFVCVLGESELAENKVTLKDMRTGEQETVSRDEIAGKIIEVKAEARA